ncbi:FG-GAP-like repeat-containing protein [Cesiribacter andamanensis]|uniref:Microbial collagenase n=1 Tax=Cesiribacter andamanensis AMV16 TaxID=1279009 RepID=M7N2F3_9BACT|nr:FG-GAP-like repeat-containing protein [Cesiribacter andamanensis]EMR02843.1 Microbial collagenase precursor [Cesiribacter andamanensis AMV16]
MKKLLFFSISLLLPASQLLAQRPVVSGISPRTATPTEVITLSGSNLPTGSNAHVQFGAARGTVVESSSSQLKVSVPAGASLEGVTVTNLASGLAGKSAQPFLLAFGGSSFDPTKFTTDAPFAGNTGMFDLCACDLNADGLVDVVSSHENSLQLSAFQNTSTLSVASFVKTNLTLNAYSRNVICGDMDGDGRPDLLVSGSGINGNRAYVLRNTSPAGGAISFGPALALPLSIGGAAMLAMQDLNADGRPEVLITSRSGNIITIFKNSSTAGNLLFDVDTPLELTISGFSSTHGLVVQDLDGDGLADIAVSPFQGSGVSLLRNTSTGSGISFTAGQSLSTEAGLINLIAADLNGDGKQDLAATNTYNDLIYTWPNTSSSGNLQFGASSSIKAGTQPWGLASGDLNGDGRPELVVSHNSASRSLFIISNTSTSSSFSLSGAHIATTENGRHPKVVDLTGDGKPDLAYTGTTSNNLRVLRNQHCVQPLLSHSGTQTLCSGQSLTLQATRAVGVVYTWTRNGTPLSATGSSIEITDAGTYAVTISAAADGCSLSSGTVQVVSGTGGGGSTVAMEPIAATCIGGSAILKATAMTGATYVWSGPNGFTTTTSTASHTLTNVQTSAAGSYSVVIKVGECQFTPVAQTLTVNSKPTASITASATAFCAGTSLTLQAPSGFAAYQWKLNGANYTGTGATTASISTGTAGSYTVVITNSNGCSAESAAVAITQTQAPVASFSAPATACLQQAVSFQNSSTYASGHTPVYAWSFGDGKTSSEANPTHTYPAAGTYTVNLTVSYGSGSCSNSSSKTITVVAAPEIELLADGPTAFCPGESVMLRLEGDVASVRWNTGATTPTLTAANSGTYTATVTTSAGCILERSLDISHLETPAISISASARSIKLGETVTLSGVGGLRYAWEASEHITDLYSSTVSVSPNRTTTYTVSGWGENGCAASASITIEVDNSLRISPPKIFVPAVDGTWVVGDIDLYPDLRLSLVNSLGRTIFEAQPYLNSWDGTERGRMLEAGVYYYIFKDAAGKVVKSGSITLLR